MTLTETLTTFSIACIEHCSISKHYASTDKHIIAIGMNATVHSRSIVINNTAYHCTIDRRWIRRKNSSKRFEYTIYSTSHQSWLHTNTCMIRSHLIVFPMLSCNDKHRVGTTLSRERCASRTEGIRGFVLTTYLNNMRNLLFILSTDYHFWSHAVETSIRTPS